MWTSGLACFARMGAAACDGCLLVIPFGEGLRQGGPGKVPTGAWGIATGNADKGVPGCSLPL